MKPSILSPFFLIFLILFTKSPFSSSVNKFKLHETITDPLIQRICHETTNPNLCLEILQQHRGKPLLPEPPRHALTIADQKVYDTAKRIWRLQGDIKDDKSEVKKVYSDCLERYKFARSELEQARKLLLNDKYIKSVYAHTSAAMGELRSCGENLYHLVKETGQHEPKFLARDSAMVYHLCSVVLGICDAVLDPRK